MAKLKELSLPWPWLTALFHELAVTLAALFSGKRDKDLGAGLMFSVSPFPSSRFVRFLFHSLGVKLYDSTFASCSLGQRGKHVRQLYLKKRTDTFGNTLVVSLLIQLFQFKLK